jgi:hypothetical protein
MRDKERLKAKGKRLKEKGKRLKDEESVQNLGDCNFFSAIVWVASLNRRQSSSETLALTPNYGHIRIWGHIRLE